MKNSVYAYTKVRILSYCRLLKFGGVFVLRFNAPAGGKTNNVKEKPRKANKLLEQSRTTVALALDNVLDKRGDG